jgi:putative heme-binding domain-containing protein
VKRGILQAMLANSERTMRLLKAVEGETVSKNEIDPLTANQLKESKVKEIAEVSQKLFQSPSAEERAKILKEYQQVLELTGDPVKGRGLFEKNCSTCHKIGKIGQNVAPDISDSRTRLPPQLLNDILNPNQAIDNNYVSYTVVTTDGLSHVGIIAAESGSSITLKQPEGKTEIVLRSDIELIRSNGVSLMPEGLEKNITQPQMADIISFIKNWRYVEENVPYQN